MFLAQELIPGINLDLHGNCFDVCPFSCLFES